ncbi:hypothetical protein ACWEGE_02885 [Amycolatopsis sp. NPDC004747]
MSDEEEPAEKPDAAFGDDCSEQLARVVNQFNAPIYAAGAEFGAGSQGAAQVKAAIGKLDDTDVQTELRYYVSPACYDATFSALRKDHVVCLYGDRGTGKRSGAVALLRELTAGPLYVLSPMHKLKSLAEREYMAGSGYIIADHIAERRSADADFTWRTVRDRVRDQGAYLVVTTVVAVGTREVDAVAQVRWESPDLRRVLRVRLAGLEDAEEIGERVVRSWPDGGRLTDLVAVAGDLTEGMTVDEALPKLDASLQERVRAWFDEYRDERDYLAVTALAFLEGTRQRIFESQLGKLEAKLAEVLLEETDIVEKKRGLFRQNRVALYARENLIKIAKVGSDEVVRQCPVFREFQYRRFVLEELWFREDESFWGGISAWLDEVIPEEGLRVAGGLALLAKCALDEVVDILAPWADGRRGGPGQATATHVLWLLSYDEELAPEALRLAAHWAARGSPAERWTGAVVLSGELGARYPAEACNRLWQLILQSHTVAGNPNAALAGLFVTLSRRAEDAGVVLTLLDRKLAKPSVAPEYARATIRAIFSVLSTRDRNSGRHAATAYLCRARDSAAPIQGRLWAAVLTDKATRTRALKALKVALSDLKHLCDDPGSVATLLGRAILVALPPEVGDLMRADFAEFRIRTRTGSFLLAQHLAVPPAASAQDCRTAMTESYPIVEQRSLDPAQVKGKFFGREEYREHGELPRPNAHQVFVYRVDGEYVLDSAQRRLDEEQVVNATHVSLVDLTRDAEVIVELAIPGAEAEDFTMRVTFVCTVTNPVSVVREGRGDAQTLLRAYLKSHHRFFELGLKYRLDEINEVRRDVNAQVKAFTTVKPPVISGIAVELRSVEVLTPDEVRRLMGNRRSLEYQHELDTAQQRYELDRAEITAPAEIIDENPDSLLANASVVGSLDATDLAERLLTENRHRAEIERTDRQARLDREHEERLFEIERRNEQRRWEREQSREERKWRREDHGLARAETLRKEEITLEVIRELGKHGYLDMTNLDPNVLITKLTGAPSREQLERGSSAPPAQQGVLDDGETDDTGVREEDVS